MTDKVKPRLRTPALTVALSVFLVALFVSLFRWTLVEYLTPFIEPLLEMGIGIFFLVSLVWSVVQFIRIRKQNPSIAVPPIGVNVLTAIIVTFVPFSLLTTQLNFRAHYRDRMAVVSNVLDGEYGNLVQSSGRGDFIALPSKLSYLSSGGGEIVRLRRQNGTLVFFYDYRGILDSFSGFVYSTDDSAPKDGDFGGRFAEIERLRENWFWATSRN
jgi:hypothetical protein